jgi:hypothetical protein
MYSCSAAACLACYDDVFCEGAHMMASMQDAPACKIASKAFLLLSWWGLGPFACLHVPPLLLCYQYCQP